MLPNEINVVDNNGLLALYLLKKAAEDNTLETITLSHGFLLKWLKKDSRIHDTALKPLIKPQEKIFKSCF